MGVACARTPISVNWLARPPPSWACGRHVGPAGQLPRGHQAGAARRHARPRRGRDHRSDRRGDWLAAPHGARRLRRGAEEAARGDHRVREGRRARPGVNRRARASARPRSTTLWKRPRGAAADAGAGDADGGWVLPVSAPPTRTRLRCWARKPPPARSRTRVSLIGGPSKTNSSTSLASGSLAMAIWNLAERACFSESSAVRRSRRMVRGKLRGLQGRQDPSAGAGAVERSGSSTRSSPADPAHPPRGRARRQAQTSTRQPSGERCSAWSLSAAANW